MDRCFVREHARALRGLKVEDTKSGKKYQRTNVVGARIDGKVVALQCYTENTTGAIFVEWFKKVFVKSVPKGVTAIMDNASFHPKKKLKNLARRHGLRLLFLPPYSPDFNPIEKDWANMKRGLVDILPFEQTLQNAIFCYFNHRNC